MIPQCSVEPAISAGWSGGPGSELEKHLCEAVAGETGMPSHHAEPSGAPSPEPPDVDLLRGDPMPTLRFLNVSFVANAAVVLLSSRQPSFGLGSGNTSMG